QPPRGAASEGREGQSKEPGGRGSECPAGGAAGRWHTSGTGKTTRIPAWRWRRSGSESETCSLRTILSGRGVSDHPSSRRAHSLSRPTWGRGRGVGLWVRADARWVRTGKTSGGHDVDSEIGRVGVKTERPCSGE